MPPLISFTVNPGVTMKTYSRDCHVVAYSHPVRSAEIARSPSFRAFQETLSSSSSIITQIKESAVPSSAASIISSKTSSTTISPVGDPATPSSRVSLPTSNFPTFVPSSGGSSTSSTGGVRGNQGPSARVVTSSWGLQSTVSTTATVGGNVWGDGQLKSQNSTPFRSAIVGGLLGGVAFILLSWAFFALYSRYKSGRNAKASRHVRVRSDEEASPMSPTLPIPSFLHRRPVYDTSVYPLAYDYHHRPLEGKQERLERGQREMEETQRRRDIFQIGLEMRRHGVIDRGQNNCDVDNEVENLTRRIEQISRRIGGLELELARQGELPPNYYASIGDQ